MKKNTMLLSLLCMGLLFTGCNGGKNTQTGDLQTAMESTTQEESVSNSTESQEKETDVASQETTESQISEEERYWLQVLEDFKDSPYDLTDALTQPALKDLCNGYFSLGVGINGSTLENLTLNVPEYMTVAKKHFNSVTLTNLMKSCYILDQKGSQESLKNGDGSPVLNFASIDPTLQWCMDNGMKMRGHTLVWHAQAPDWFFREGYDENGKYVSKETMLFRMESYIAQMLTHVQDNYPGVVYCWDVVNEAVDPDKGDKNSAFLCRTESDAGENPWYMTIGEDYVEMAFTYARKYADPEVKLFYNDFNTYMIPKRNAIVTLCQGLKEKGLIDGIGMQGYYGVDYPDINSIEVTIKQFAKLDLEIQLTELSVDLSEETDEMFEKQAKKYGNILLTLHGLDTDFGGPANITNVTFFGLIDHYREGDKTNARLFDSKYQLKPSFCKVRDILNNIYMK